MSDQTPEIKKTTEIYQDFQYTVRYTAKEHWINFSASVIVGSETDALASPLYETQGDRDNFTPDITRARISFEGFVKWDGCMEISFNDSLHLCGAKQLSALIEVLERINARSAELMKEMGGDPTPGQHFES